MYILYHICEFEPKSKKKKICREEKIFIIHTKMRQRKGFDYNSSDDNSEHITPIISIKLINYSNSDPDHNNNNIEIMALF